MSTMILAELNVASDIADRALAMFNEMGIKRSKQDWLMDVCFAHKAVPLRLVALRDADEFNFCHDLGGIMNHLNRETFELEDCFVPRFARQET